MALELQAELTFPPVYRPDSEWSFTSAAHPSVLLVLYLCKSYLLVKLLSSRDSINNTKLFTKKCKIYENSKLYKMCVSVVNFILVFCFYHLVFFSFL